MNEKQISSIVFVFLSFLTLSCLFKYYHYQPKNVTIKPLPTNLSDSLSTLYQSDSLLISAAESIIIPPSELPYTFGPVQPTGIVISFLSTLKKLSGAGGKNGFFVEAGAYDGITGSNTVWLEKTYGWTGLLVECHPKSLESLKETHRNAYIAPVCLSTSNHAVKSMMTSVEEWNPASYLEPGDIFSTFQNFSHIEVQTFPLYTLLAAIKVNVVDFISLDIQSAEYKVIQYFPFDMVLVKSWLIKVDLLSTNEKSNLLRLMRSNGYRLKSKLTRSEYFFIHNSAIKGSNSYFL